MIVDAVVLSGGQGVRLGGESKAALELDGVSLLDRTLAACQGVRRIVVVGDAVAWASGDRTPGGADVIVTREDPPFGGPVAALAAGLDVLSHAAREADAVLVLAVDMPHVATLVPLLLDATRDALLEAEGAEAVLASDADGIAQPLAAVYRAGPVRRALESLASEHGKTVGSTRPPLDGQPMRAVTGRMAITTIEAPSGTTDDVDTAADARELGVTRARQHAGSSNLEVPHDR